MQQRCGEQLMGTPQDSLLASLRAENAQLRSQLAAYASAEDAAAAAQGPEHGLGWEGCGLSSSQVSRYSRHLVLPSFGPQGNPHDLECDI